MGSPPPPAEGPPELPSLYHASDMAAINSQRKHLLLLTLRLIFLIGVAVIAAVSWSIFNLQVLAIAFTGSLLVLGLAISIVQASRRFDRQWFIARSIAESMKAQAWFYMMRVKPYETEGADEAFRESMKLILARHQSIPPSIVAEGSSGDEITDDMRRMRDQPLEFQRTSYVKNRLSEQRTWYASKSLHFSNRESWWFYFSIGLQLAAALLALSMAIVMTDPSGFNVTFAYFNPVGIATTAASASLAWSESKRYGELARSYSIVAGGLRDLESKARQIENQDQLRLLVSETERSISQEHEVWLTRSLRD